MEKHSYCFCTKNGDVVVSIGDNVSLLVEGRDEIVGGIVTKIYARAIQFEGNVELWHESDIIQIYKD